eukprot:scaffold502_cov350-Pavlova_lutheri.AAC.5
MMLGSSAFKNVFRVCSDDEASWRCRRPSTDRWFVVFPVDSIRSVMPPFPSVFVERVART